MAPNTDPLSGSLIFILEDDAATAAACRENIAARFAPNVRAFESFEEMTADPELDRVDLFIVDVKLGGELSGFEVPDHLPARCRFAAFLFMSGYAVDPEQYDKAAGLPFFDFIAKPFAMVYLVHRCRMLLAARLKMPAGLEDKLLELWTHTPYFALVIDKDFCIRLANHQLAALLEVKSAGALVGRTWADFLPVALVDGYRDIYKTILAGDLSQFGEFTGDVCATNGTVHRVKWFHSPFLGSEENDILILSVGLPYRFKLTVADDLRRAWKESILMHRAAIQAIKKLPFKTDPPNMCQLDEVILP